MILLKAIEYFRALYALSEESGAEHSIPCFSWFPNASEDSVAEIFILFRSNLIIVVGCFPYLTSKDAMALFYIICLNSDVASPSYSLKYYAKIPFSLLLSTSGNAQSQ